MPSWAFLSVPVVRPETTPVSCPIPWIPWLGEPKASVHELFPPTVGCNGDPPATAQIRLPRASVSPVSFSTAGVGGRVPETWPPTSRGRQPTGVPWLQSNRPWKFGPRTQLSYPLDCGIRRGAPSLLGKQRLRGWQSPATSAAWDGFSATAVDRQP